MKVYTLERKHIKDFLPRHQSKRLVRDEERVNVVCFFGEKKKKKHYGIFNFSQILMCLKYYIRCFFM